MDDRTVTRTFTTAEIQDAIRIVDNDFCCGWLDMPSRIVKAERARMLLDWALTDEEREELTGAIAYRHAEHPTLKNGRKCDHRCRPYPVWSGIDAAADFDADELRRARARVLHQGDYWIDATGQTHRLTDMDPRHRRNVQRMLRRGARRFCLSESWAASAYAAQTGGEMAADAADRAAAELLEAAFANDTEDAEEHLEGCALMRALIELDGRCL